MEPNVDKKTLYDKFIKGLEQLKENGQNEICAPDGTIEVEYNEDKVYYLFELNFEVTSMPRYDEYSGSEWEPPYSVCRSETEWEFKDDGNVYVDGDKVCSISDIFDFTPENEEKLKDMFEVNDAEILSAEHERYLRDTGWYDRFNNNSLNENRIRRIISEELDKKEVKDMINKAIDDILSDTKFRKKVISITADVLEDFMDNLWTRKPFWKSIIKRS